MSPEEQERYRPLGAQRLETSEYETRALADDTQNIAPDPSIGRLSRFDSMQQQQMALAGKRRLEDERIPFAFHRRSCTRRPCDRRNWRRCSARREQIALPRS